MNGIKFEEKFIIKGPEGEISETAIRSAQEIVQNYADTTASHPLKPVFKFPSPLRLWDDNEDWKVWMVKKGEFSGTWPKRYVGFVWKKYGLRPPEKMVSMIGQALANSANLQAEYLIDFTKNCNWKPGAFGESNTSCWWSDYKGARIGLFENGGFAMRFYSATGKGEGRCWVFPFRGVLYMFNAYHKSGMNLYTMACLLAAHVGTSYKAIRLSAQKAWINGDTGYALGPIEKLEEIAKKDVCLKFAVDCDTDDNDEMYICYECDCEFYDEGDGDYYNGHWYCQSCYDRLFFTCNRCEDVYPRSQETEFDDGCYCSNCLPEVATECSDCHTLHPAGEECSCKKESVE